MKSLKILYAAQYLVVNPSVLEIHSKKEFGGENIGITGAVPTSFFWGQPLDERFKEALYQDFKSYVLKRIDRQDFSTDLALRSQLEGPCERRVGESGSKCRRPSSENPIRHT